MFLILGAVATQPSILHTNLGFPGPRIVNSVVPLGRLGGLWGAEIRHITYGIACGGHVDPSLVQQCHQRRQLAGKRRLHRLSPILPPKLLQNPCQNHQPWLAFQGWQIRLLVVGLTGGVPPMTYRLSSLSCRCLCGRIWGCLGQWDTHLGPSPGIKLGPLVDLGLGF